MTPLLLAIGANSPTLFGHRLWQETRIALFKQSIDTRHVDRYEWNEPARVNFGHGWCRQGAYELFSESVNLYPTLLPICYDNEETKEDCPLLSELRLHQSTVWLWNRPVFDPIEGGHLRIEMRSLPSGPTPIDMFANAAFLIGLAEGYRSSIDDAISAVPFQTAEFNFYRAAQQGLNAKIIWPNSTCGYRKTEITKVIENHLDSAQQGLEKIGIGNDEINRYLNIIAKRLETRQNGSTWQLQTLNKLNQTLNKQESLHKMLELFIHNSQSNIPVAEWPICSTL